MRLTVCFAALAATLVATPALAQSYPSDTATATAKGTVLQSHQLVNGSPLDFGIVTVDSVNGGTVSITASGTPVRTTGGAGGVTALPSSISAARFDGLAAPLENVVLSLGSLPTLTDANNSGNFTVYVGGDFSLSAGQPSGVYSGTFQLTAQYQ
jgi:hypothetical protein